MLYRKTKAYSFIEILVVIVIMGLTSTIAVTLFSPGKSTHRQKAVTQLEQLKNAIILHNARNPQNIFRDENTGALPGPLWWILLPGVHDKNLVDPWNNPYEHDFYKGIVYSYGPDMINDNGDNDDVDALYRPPSAEITARYPQPGSVINSNNPTIATTWTFGGGIDLANAKVFLDKILIGDATISNDTSDPHYSLGMATKTITGLSDGIHYIQVLIEDSKHNSRRAGWSFRVDTHPPNIHTMNPPQGVLPPVAPGPMFEFSNPLVSCLYHDASGIDLSSVEFDLTTPGGSVVGGPLDYPSLKTNIEFSFDISGNGISFRPPAGGLGDEPHTATLDIADIAGNSTQMNWYFSIEDNTAPQVQIHQPVYGTSITTASDIDSDPTNGIQVAVIGTTERSNAGTQIIVELQNEHGGSPVGWLDGTNNVTVLTVNADPTGYFKFPMVTVKDNDGAVDDPVNDISVKVTDDSSNSSTAATKLYVFNAANQLQCSVRANPMTTHPNKAIVFSLSADKGTTPYTYVWDFDDGFTREGVLETMNTTVSVSHAYATTGNFNSICQVTDNRGLTATSSQNVYVGTEEMSPSLFLEAVPPEVYCGIPGGETQFRIRIGGKYLGQWQLRVESNTNSRPNFRWYHSKRGDGMYNTAEGTDTAPDLEDDTNPTWITASSNDFVIEWDGTDNHADTGIDFALNPKRKFPSNRNYSSTNDRYLDNRYHIATLSYSDALGEMSETTAEVIVYSSVPEPEGLRIASVRNMPNSPQLFDKNSDGYFDFTNSGKVDVQTRTPSSTNPSHVWLSNYPLELHKVLCSNPLFTDYKYQNPEGEIFWNWGMTDGANYSASDGSSGWFPIKKMKGELNEIWDWPITGWPGESRIASDFNNDAIIVPAMLRDWYYPQSEFEAMPLTGGTNKWSALGEPGLNKSHDGSKTIYGIFQDADVFSSTQKENSAKASDGVTSVSIFFDNSPPVPQERPRFKNIEVVGDWDDIHTLSVVATIECTATDMCADNLGHVFEGVGFIPNGLIVVSGGEFGTRMISYTKEFDYEFGRLYDNNGASNLPSIAPNSVLSATVNFRDNLGNRSLLGSNGELEIATASISKYMWTLTGGSDFAYYQKHNRDSYRLINIEENTGDPGKKKVANAHNKSIDTTAPARVDWLSNGTSLDGVIYEDAYVYDNSNISSDHFPVDDDRLGYLHARRPEYPWAIEQTTTFTVDDSHYYYLIMMKGDIYVEYRVYSGNASDPACQPAAVREHSGAAVAAEYIVLATGKFDLVAILDKVSRSNFNPPRINEAEMYLPGEDSESGGNYAIGYRDLHASPDDNGPFLTSHPDNVYDYKMHWDEMTDLLIEDSSSSTNFETYTYRGVFLGKDGGTIGKPDYKITSNCFSAKMGFVDESSPEAPITTNRYTESTDQLYHQKLIKAELVDPVGGNGWGINVNNTFIYDASSGGYNALGRDLVSGTNFKIEYSNYSNDFERLTTGTIHANIQLHVAFTSPESYARVTTNGLVITDDMDADSWASTDPVTSTWFYVNPLATGAQPTGFSDVRGDHTIFSSDINWPVLAGATGTLEAKVSYMDSESNVLSAQTVTAHIDANPPTIGVDGIELWSYPGYEKYYNNGGTTFTRSSVDSTRWTSMAQFVVDYTEVSDAGGLYREIVGVDPVNVGAANAIGTFVAHPVDYAAGIKDGDASPGPNPPGTGYGLASRWLSIVPSDEERMTWVHATGPSVIQGMNTLYFRIKDDANNINPPYVGVDEGQGLEPELPYWIHRDTESPVSNFVSGSFDPVSVVNSPVSSFETMFVARNQGGIWWTNQEEPLFTWESTDAGFAVGDSSTGSGVIASNFAISNSPVDPTVPETYPLDVTALDKVEIDLGAGSGTTLGTSEFRVSANADSSHYDGNLDSVSGSGIKNFRVRGVDLVGNAQSPLSTTFRFEDEGPVITPASGTFHYRKFVVDQKTKEFTSTNNGNGWKNNEKWDFMDGDFDDMSVEAIKISCSKGHVAFKDFRLKTKSDGNLSPDWVERSATHGTISTFTYEYEESNQNNVSFYNWPIAADREYLYWIDSWKWYNGRGGSVSSNKER